MKNLKYKLLQLLEVKIFLKVYNENWHIFYRKLNYLVQLQVDIRVRNPLVIKLDEKS